MSFLVAVYRSDLRPPNLQFAVGVGRFHSQSAELHLLAWLCTLHGIPQLEMTFKFANFIAAMAFANRITEIAEANDHHPALLIEYGSVKVSWWSHSIRGLHLNDFVLAAKTDKAYIS